jgi:DNA polymerase (family 10)
MSGSFDALVWIGLHWILGENMPGGGLTYPQNLELAQVFEEIGNLLLYRGENRFAALSYLRYAKLLRELEEPIAEVAQRGGLEALPGVGEAIASKTRDYLAGGTFPLQERLRQEVPPGIWALLRQGASPTLLRELEKRGIDSPAALEVALCDGRLSAGQIPSRLREAFERLVSHDEAGAAQV